MNTLLSSLSLLSLSLSLLTLHLYAVPVSQIEDIVPHLPCNLVRALFSVHKHNIHSEKGDGGQSSVSDWGRSSPYISLGDFGSCHSYSPCLEAMKEGIGDFKKRTFTIPKRIIPGVEWRDLDGQETQPPIILEVEKSLHSPEP